MSKCPFCKKEYSPVYSDREACSECIKEWIDLKMAEARRLEEEEARRLEEVDE